MRNDSTLLLSRNDVQELLSLSDCINAVEKAFRLQGEGKIPRSEILGVKAPGGSLHVKAAFLPTQNGYLVAKLNANFPQNPARFGLPTIQGVIIVCDADNGSPLALLDSIDITIKRTAAASAVAAKFLARRDSSVATVCGCGEQGRAQLRALHSVVPFEKIFAFDLDKSAAKNLSTGLSSELKIDIETVGDVTKAIRQSDLIVTCTAATEFFVRKEDARPGTFIAAVGADGAHKQEIDPGLIASAKIVADSREQSCSIGDTHHAIAKGLMQKEDVYAELGEIVAGKKHGRTSDEEIIIFDSTGVAIEDAAAAAIVYEKACARKFENRFAFAA